MRDLVCRILFHRCVAFLILIFNITIISGCSTPSDRGGAQSQVILGGLVKITPTNSNDPNARYQTEIGLSTLGNTQVVKASQSCEGAVGSIIPPISFVGCGGALTSLPLNLLEDFTNWIAGSKDTAETHLLLDDAEQYLIQQSNQNDCWAATIEMARAFLKLPRVSQEDILSLSDKYCPLIKTQPYGADAFQIIHMILKIAQAYDGHGPDSHFCNDYQCIVRSLEKSHPVIMLESGHAVLIVGIDYFADPAVTHGQFIVSPKRFYILDPMDKAGVKTWTPLSVCHADVFISY